MSKKIYFICKGTSSNDIINSVNKINKKIRYKPETEPNKELSFWNELTTFMSSGPKNKVNKLSDVKEDDFSRLTEIGMKELFISQDNNDEFYFKDQEVIEPIVSFTNEKHNLQTSLVFLPKIDTTWVNTNQLLD